MTFDPMLGYDPEYAERWVEGCLETFACEQPILMIPMSARATFRWVDTEKASWRYAMQAMANVMACAVEAFKGRDAAIAWYAWQTWTVDRLGFKATLPDPVRLYPCINRDQVTRIASREWSAEVRRKVKALKPSGVQVTCQGDWIDD